MRSLSHAQTSSGQLFVRGEEEKSVPDRCRMKFSVGTTILGENELTSPCSPVYGITLDHGGTSFWIDFVERLISFPNGIGAVQNGTNCISAANSQGV